MKEQLISFNTAKLAKEKGFIGIKPQAINWYYKDGTLNEEKNIDGYKGLKGWNTWDSTQGIRWDAPTQSLLQKWLRDEHNIQVYVRGVDFQVWSCYVSEYGRQLVTDYIYGEAYEEALEKGLIEALKLT